MEGRAEGAWPFPVCPGLSLAGSTPGRGRLLLLPTIVSGSGCDCSGQPLTEAWFHACSQRWVLRGSACSQGPILFVTLPSGPASAWARPRPASVKQLSLDTCRRGRCGLAVTDTPAQMERGQLCGPEGKQPWEKVVWPGRCLRQVPGL